MSFEITTAFVKQYSDNITILSQQKGSKLLGTTMTKTDVVGEETYMDQIGATEVVERTSRHSDSPLISTPHARRRITMRDFEWGDLIDKFDMVQTLIDPQNAYVQAGGYAMGRKIDDIIIESFFADAQTGKTGGTTVSFPAGNQVAVDHNSSGTNSNLTVGKLREARKLLKAAEVDLDMEQPYIAVTAEQEDALLGTVEVTSADYNGVKALVNGDVDTFLGFKFIRTERLAVDGSGFRRVPVWVPSGVGLALPMSPTARVTERADKSFSWYAYYSARFGASRLEEEKVIEIKCDETV